MSVSVAVAKENNLIWLNEYNYVRQVYSYGPHPCAEWDKTKAP